MGKCNLVPSTKYCYKAMSFTRNYFIFSKRELAESNTRIVYSGEARINKYEDQKLKKKLERENSLKKGTKNHFLASFSLFHLCYLIDSLLSPK